MRISARFDTVKMNEEDDMVTSLLSRPFAKRSQDEQKWILDKGRPAPQLNLQQKEKNSVRTFNVSWYTHHRWLAGSEKLQMLFCWPCLLLATEKSRFSWYGYTDLKNMSRSTERHGASKEHLMNVLSYRQLLNQDIPNSILSNDTDKLVKEKYNNQVKLNREIFKKIIDATCLLTEQYHVISPHQETSEDPMDNRRFKSLLELLLSYEQHLLDHYKGEAYLCRMSKTVIFEIVQCVNEAIKGSVGEIINKAHFYSVMVDDASDIIESLKCAVYVRLINEGKLQEYFLGFHDMDRTPASLAATINTVLNKFDLKGKMVSLSLDGSVVNVGCFAQFEDIIHQGAEQAILTHCFAYKLTYIVQQICGTIEGVKSFFASIQGIPFFFNQHPNRQQVLHKYVLKRIPTCVEDSWSASSKFLDAILSERLSLMETFQHIATCEEFNAKTIREAEAYRNKLDQTDLVFLLLVFRDIFAKIEILDAFLQRNSNETKQCWESVLYTITEFEGMRTEGKYNEYSSIAFNGKGFVKIENGEDMDIYAEYKISYFQILDYIKTHLYERLSNLKKLNFMVLGDTSKVFEESDTNNQVSSITSLEATYGHHFNKERLRNELESIFSPQYKKNFECSNFFDLIQKMEKSEYNLILPEVYKMFCLLATIPYHSNERKACHLKKFRSCSGDKISMQNLNALARLFYERDILAKLKKTPHFYENIIDKFAAKKERKINLLYRR